MPDRGRACQTGRVDHRGVVRVADPHADDDIVGKAQPSSCPRKSLVVPGLDRRDEIIGTQRRIRAHFRGTRHVISQDVTEDETRSGGQETVLPVACALIVLLFCRRLAAASILELVNDTAVIVDHAQRSTLVDTNTPPLDSTEKALRQFQRL